MKTITTLLMVKTFFCFVATSLYAQEQGSNKLLPKSIDIEATREKTFYSIEVNESSITPYQQHDFNAQKSEEIADPHSQHLQFVKGETGTVTDIDGNVYTTIKIGDRWWMAENLKVSKYRNGDPIPDGTGINNLDDENDPKYFFYINHDPSTEEVYGKLYTWYVVSDPSDLCPDGWYVPTEEDMFNLQLTIDPEGNNNYEGNIAGGKMKTTGTIEEETGLWYQPNVGATNESGFSADPSGYFGSWTSGYEFRLQGYSFRMLSSTSSSYSYAYYGSIWNSEAAYYVSSNAEKKGGFAVRCVKNVSEDINLPTVITVPAEEITQYSVKVGGLVTNNGGESVSNRGVYWSTSSNPTADNSITFNGSGIGLFQTTISDLQLSTTYYFRAYAQNCNGTALGEVYSFTTLGITSSMALSIASNSFINFWQVIKAYNIAMTAEVMADHTTVSWGNFAWRDQSWEPRIPWDNSPYYTNADMTLTVWNGLYNLLKPINDVMHAINNLNLQVGSGGVDNAKVLATMHFIRGISLGYLGITFDKAWIAQNNNLPQSNDLSPWYQVLEAAVEDLEQAAALCSENTFSWDFQVVSGMYFSSTYLGQLANSYAARFLTNGARTLEQNQDLSWTNKYSWSDVLNFTNNGITLDFAPVGNGLPWDGGSWWDLNIKYLRQSGWGRVDMRVVNLLDPNQPVRYPTDSDGLPNAGTPPNNGLAVSGDARLLTDFQYLPTNEFLAVRGGWHFSHYRHSRYDFPATTNTEGFYMGESKGPLRELRAYDNELMKAEALARTGNLTDAAAILNNSQNPRKSRGQLPDVAAEEDAVLNAIFYERNIELFHNGYMISFCDMRRRDLLQYGTPLHFPVPGSILSYLSIENYTYGGYNNADGVNTSNGGQWIKPFYHFVDNNIVFNVFSGGNPVEAAQIIFDNSPAIHYTNVDGILSVGLLDGFYDYCVSKQGFDIYNGSFGAFGGGFPLYIELLPNSSPSELFFNPNVYPNPCNHYLKVENDGNIYQIIIRNILGQEVTIIPVKGDQITTIITSNLPNGIYLLELHSINGKRSVKKIIKN
jgi:uncharacterized protein (TIGR02145 family)